MSIEAKDIERDKQTLISKSKANGIYENFGDKEAVQLRDKYGHTQAIAEFVEWAMNFDGSD